MDIKEKYKKILEWFGSTMSQPRSELHYDNPYQLLVAVMLSAQCTDKRVNLVTPALFAAYPDAGSLAEATESEIFEYIKSVSYPNSKASHLKSMAEGLQARFGGRVPDTREDLQGLPGVGRKTANVVLAVAFGKPAMPVDTHVFRVAHRLGLVSDKENTPEKTEAVLTANIPEEALTDAHHYLLLHGRYVCTAKNPKCGTCGLAGLCPSAGKDLG